MFVDPVAIYIDSSIDMTVRICAGACADMHELRCRHVDIHVWRHVCGHAYRHECGHVHRHVCRNVYGPLWACVWPCACGAEMCIDMFVGMWMEVYKCGVYTWLQIDIYIGKMYEHLHGHVYRHV